MTGNNSKRQTTWRALALVLLTVLLGVGSCSYLTGQNTNRPAHAQASSPGHGAATAAPGAGSAGSAGSVAGPPAGPSATGTAGPGAASGTPASMSGTPGGTPAAPQTSAAAPTAEPESAGTPGAGSTAPPAGKSSTPSSPTSGGSNFSVSVSPAGELYPGAAAPLDLSLTNPNGHVISLTSLTVAVKSITLSASPRSPGRCSLGDFQIEQLSGSLPIRVGAGQTVTLSKLGFPAAQMPEIRMVDQPYNQDGCQGARLSFSYSGTATG